MSAPRLLYVGHLRPNPSWAMAAHAHPHDELIVILRGCLRLRIGEERREVRAGQLLLYPAHCAHEESSDPRAPVESLYLGVTTLGAGAVPLQMPDRDRRVRQLAEWALAERHGGTEESSDCVHAFVMALRSELLRLARQTEEGFALVSLTRRFIEAHIEEPLPLERLAKQAGLSRFHFARRYRALARRSPVQEVRELRLARARELLFTTDLPLKTIAPMVGLADEYRLSHLMRARFGVPPGRMRQEARG